MNDALAIAVVGAHLAGQPLHHELTDRSAVLVAETTTAPLYRMFALDTDPPKPGLVRVGPGNEGTAFEVEVWKMEPEQFATLVAGVPSPLCIGQVLLADGISVSGFLCEPFAVDGASDISRFGGWRAYMNQLPSGERRELVDAPGRVGPDIDRVDVVAEVTRSFEQYERDLVANDVDALVTWFWDDPRAVRYGIDESHVGHDDIAAYRRSQAMATPPRRLRNTVITALGRDVAVASTEFLPDGSDAVGRQSQTWARLRGRWRIVAAHVSWLGGRRP